MRLVLFATFTTICGILLTTLTLLKYLGILTLQPITLGVLAWVVLIWWSIWVITTMVIVRMLRVDVKWLREIRRIVRGSARSVASSFREHHQTLSFAELLWLWGDLISAMTDDAMLYNKSLMTFRKLRRIPLARWFVPKEVDELEYIDLRTYFRDFKR